jgi:hypothetical protein
MDGNIDDLLSAFEHSIKVKPTKMTPHDYKLVHKTIPSVLKVPWRLTDMVIITLEKIGDGARATPDFLMR